MRFIVNKCPMTEARKQLQSRQQDVEVKSVALSASREELRNVIEAYKAKEQGYLDKIEAAEIARAKASRSESTSKIDCSVFLAGN